MGLVSEEVKPDGEHVIEEDILFLEELAQVFKKHPEVAAKWGVSHHLPDRLVKSLVPREEVMFFSQANPIDQLPATPPPPALRRFRRIVEVRASGASSFCCDLCWDGQLYCCGMCD